MIYVKRDVDMDVHPYLLAGMAYLGYKSEYDWKITSGRRSPQAQSELYAAGRTMPGSVVTDAPVGTSAHEFGLAIDAYPTEDKGATIILDLGHPAFAERDLLFKRSGFLGTALDTSVVISSGPDTPHIQLRNWQKSKDWHTTLIAVGAVSALVSLFLLTR